MFEYSIYPWSTINGIAAKTKASMSDSVSLNFFLKKLKTSKTPEV
ncbi:MAG: hypothetical protein NTZ89_00010 [Actinobacteria bacterium]|nr:hypothetical protein [Actinomycetota bacterium]